MLDAHRQQASGFQFERLAVPVQGADPAVLDALHVLVETGYGQAAFLHGFRLAVENLDFRVDEHPGLAFVLGQVHDDDLLVDVDLGGCQADALGIVHGLEHVVDQLPDVVRHRLHRLGDGAQARVRVFEDL